ncbi:exopolysaccharide biosynthesis protein/3',5'-cyclic AMP phosphodiesterase CpdA [Kribbella aluminosa]|uniref:Exopolysaccharide biosynthesis protein/3',5'-cyclic AMP phosphodiesterase CpdA n=1 Tax=Kribbella aluminosa TaxID=416017 RepID=A0ABS4UD31_9ACTN|nr:phosphodiester glycosidase family protein [Kribbella aluminosa]MBP2349549.1 exopolysaccharide biosynthesis protein/3',5'-cyclic AMP phosphodiesterase CpdA [Kribbella aluminosa]
MKAHRLTAGIAVVAAAGVLWSLPAVGYADDHPVAGLALVDTNESVGPGISLNHVKRVDQRGWVDAQYLTIDLADKAVSTDLLTSGPVASGGPLSTAANKAGAVAGVNGEFFDIGNSNASLGGEVQNGQLLKSADASGRQHVGVSMDGIAQLVDLAVDSTATFAGTDHKVLTINAANGGGVPANGLVAYTPIWGEYSRARGFANADVAEVLVQQGKVVSVNPTAAGAGAIPADGFYLVGRDAAATALRALQPGDAVTLHYELANDLAKSMKFALGQGGTIVKDGKAVPGLDKSIAPRTALGFKDGGRTLVLATWDGPGGTGKGGLGIDREAQDLADRGIQTAVNLDGGGSTTMVARGLGEAGTTVRNNPSDGQERNDPNGVGVFVSKGDGKVHQLMIKPATGQAAADGGLKVFPGMHRALTVKAVDNHLTPVDPKRLVWKAKGGNLRDGIVTAPAAGNRPITVSAHSENVHTTQRVDVLGPLKSLEPSTERLSIPDATAANAVTVGITGRDPQGYTAPIDPRDLKLDYDHAVVDVQAADGKLKIVPLANAGTILTISAAGRTVKLPITVGVETKVVYDFDDDVLARWNNNSTAATTRSVDPDGLRIDFPAMRNVGISANGAANRIQVPGQPLRLRLRIKSSIDVPSGLDYVGLYDGNGKSLGLYGTGLKASRDYQNVTWTLPANTVYPVSISSYQGINTAVAQQKAGTFVLDRFEADVPTSIDLPKQPDLVADPLVSADGTLNTGTFKFATLSDVQFTADNPALSQVATAALARIRKTRPDLVVLNGDITDRGLPQDLSLARKVLTDAGCDLIPVGKEPAPSSTPKGSTVPCYYVPGNHESYGLNNTQSDLTNFTNEFGRPYRTFDHKGTRFILLASALGTLRTSAWDQLPMLERALDGAAKDRSIHNVMVFAHHPVDDPEETKSSQLGDRDEVALIEKLLTNFRNSTDKGAAMVGSHAQVANVHRVEGVPYAVLPSSGKDPYGTPDRGGFTGWVDWSVDARRNAGQQWLEADVRAFAESVTLDFPKTLSAGKAVQLDGSIVQPEGVGAGTRVVPLRFPMSVHWTGSSNLAIGGTVDQARRTGKVAVLDPVTRTLTAIRPGNVTVSVTNDSMRAYTDDASLAPITTSASITVGRQ